MRMPVILLRLPLHLHRLAILVALFCHPSSAQVPCSAPASGEPSRFCVQLAIKDGSIIRSETAIRMSGVMQSRLTEFPASRLESRMLAILDQALAELPKPYPDEQGFSNFTGSWSDFATNAAGTLGDDMLVQLYGSGPVLSQLASLSENSPLTFAGENFDPALGIAEFSIADPFDARAVDIQIGSMAATNARQRREGRLRQILVEFKGRLWCGKCYVAPLQEYYSALEFPATIIPGRALQNQIAITEGLRISRIDVSEAQDNDVDILAYYLLNERDYRTWLRSRPAGKVSAIDYRSDLKYPEDAEPYVVASILERQQLDVAQREYTLVPVSDTPVTVYIKVRRIEDAASSGDKSPKQADPDVNPSAGMVEAKPSVGEQVPGASISDQLEKPRKGSRFVGGGIEYQPGQSIRGFGLTSATDLPRPWPTRVSISGGYPWGDLITGNARWDFVGFGKLHRPLSFGVSGMPKASLQRFIGGSNMDQQRQGGAARMELELFHDWGGMLLRLYGEARHETVTLKKGDDVAGKQNLNLLEAGGLYWFHQAEVELPSWITVRPQIRFGLGMAASEPAFQVARLSLEWLQAYRHGLGSFSAVRMSFSSRNTPIIEIPSLGGVESVRGFRTDDAIGRRTWALQNELRAPLLFWRSRQPGSPSQGSGMSLGDILRRLQWAPLFDVGAAYRTVGAKPGLRAGAGLGLRLKFSSVEIGTDWAYAVKGEAATGGSRGKFYFVVRTNLPY